MHEIPIPYATKTQLEKRLKEKGVYCVLHASPFVWIGHYERDKMVVKRKDIINGVKGNDGSQLYRLSNGKVVAYNGGVINQRAKLEESIQPNDDVTVWTIEPLCWYVIDSYQGGDLKDLICVNAITTYPFNASGEVRFTKSEVKRWLNEDFYNRAFTPKEKEWLQSVYINDTPYLDGNGDEDEGYTVWLPSYQDFYDNRLYSREIQFTDYAAQGSLLTNGELCGLMTRSITDGKVVASDALACYTPTKRIDFGSTECGIMPMICVDIYWIK